MRLPRVVLANMVMCLLVLHVTGATASSTSADPSWTIMVYMANDSTSPLPSEDNLNAMEAAIHASGTNIVALQDEPGDGNSRILKIQHDSNSDQTPIVSTTVEDNGAVIDPSDEVNTGAAQTLSSFVTFATANWPADRYVLVLWGHGAGWDGLCLDRYDLLDLTELKTALTEIREILGRPIDITAVDACVEATAETLHQIRGCVDYLVAAQTNMPYQGLPYYQILTGLAGDPGQETVAFANTIVNEYISWSVTNAQDSVTLSVFDVAKVAPFAYALDKLAEQGLKYETMFHSSIQEAMADAEHYETDWTFDVGDFLVKLSASDVPLELKALAVDAFAAYSSMVEYSAKFNHPDPSNGISVTNASGAVVYAPSTSPFDVRYQDIDFASTDWDEFSMAARIVASSAENGPDPGIVYADGDDDGRSDSVTLVWTEPSDNVSAWIFRDSPSGMTLVDVRESDNGSITISDLAGDFTVAASSSVNGSAVAYSSISITLYGESTIKVYLSLDGDRVSEGYDVRVVSTNLIDYAGSSGGVFYVSLAIPTQATVGQLVTIQVLDEEGQVVWSECAFVPEGESAMTAEMVSQKETIGTDPYVLLLFSVLPGLFVLAYTIMLYIDLRKKNRKG